MKAIAILPFDDLQDGVSREPGDVFECTAERFEQINSTEFGQLAKAAESSKQAAKKPAARKPAAKKPTAKMAEGE